VIAGKGGVVFRDFVGDPSSAGQARVRTRAEARTILLP
jgi:hypothetical protein